MLRKWTGRYASWTFETSFLYAGIKEDVFVAETPGFETQGKNGVPFVMKIGKSLYGLAQSPGNWFHTIGPVLISIGLVPLKSDTCIYIYDHDRIIVILTLYVDDLLVTGGDIQLMEKIKRKLLDQFKMTDIGDISLVLGMHVTRDRQGKTLTISQENYTKSILERFGMADCMQTV